MIITLPFKVVLTKSSIKWGNTFNLGLIARGKPLAFMPLTFNTA